MIILNADDVRRALPMIEAIEAMKDAYASLSDGTAVVPLRTRLPIPDSDALSLFMPAYVQTRMIRRWRSKPSRSSHQPRPRTGLHPGRRSRLRSTDGTGAGAARRQFPDRHPHRRGGRRGIELLSRPDSKVGSHIRRGRAGTHTARSRLHRPKGSKRFTSSIPNRDKSARLCR
jgi:hypothetical protein